MTVYNGQDYLRAAIDSVLAQTYADFELLVVDDCSPDDSAKIAAGYDDPRIRLVHNERNLGQIRSLNRGLEEARGEYVARLDQDDACLPERLERQVTWLDARPRAALVGTWMDVHDDGGRLVWEYRPRVDDMADCVFLMLTNQHPFSHPTMMFRLEEVRAVGGYDPSVRFAEDQDLWRRLLLAGHRAGVVHEPLVRYLTHAGQQSQRHWEEQQEANRAALDRFIVELAGDERARALRLLLTWDDDFWREYGTGAEARRTALALERLIEAAPDRFQLDPADAAKLERLLRDRAALAARRSLRSGVATHWRASVPLLRTGLHGQDGPSAGLAAAFVYLAAPLLVVLRHAKHVLVRLIWTQPWFGAAKRRLKRTRSARLAYRVATRGRTTR
jgi:glycosyltransferase involved in cell wall biosynthesis